MDERAGCGERTGVHGWSEEEVDCVESDNDQQGNGGEGLTMVQRNKKKYREQKR